jgi:hypothetical protein
VGWLDVRSALVEISPDLFFISETLIHGHPTALLFAQNEKKLFIDLAMSIPS